MSAAHACGVYTCNKGLYEENSCMDDSGRTPKESLHGMTSWVEEWKNFIFNPFFGTRREEGQRCRGAMGNEVHPLILWNIRNNQFVNRCHILEPIFRISKSKERCICSNNSFSSQHHPMSALYYIITIFRWNIFKSKLNNNWSNWFKLHENHMDARECITCECMWCTWMHVTQVNACDALHVNACDARECMWCMWMHVMHGNACECTWTKNMLQPHASLHEASRSASLEQRQPADPWSTCSSIQRQIKCMPAAATKIQLMESGCAVSKILVGIKIINQSRKIKGRSRLSLYRRALKRPTARGLSEIIKIVITMP